MNLTWVPPLCTCPPVKERPVRCSWARECDPPLPSRGVVPPQSLKKVVFFVETHDLSKRKSPLPLTFLPFPAPARPSPPLFGFARLTRFLFPLFVIVGGRSSNLTKLLQ